MIQFMRLLGEFFADSAVYWLMFIGSLSLALLLVPVVREFNRSIGMVDNPGPRRVNKLPIPRGGGVGVFLAVVIAGVVCDLFRPGSVLPDLTRVQAATLGGLAAALVAVGYADDKFGLHPLVKLAGQVAVAALAHFLCGVGFGEVFESIPGWLDAIFTIFWIVGAINAFNLIDGIDGLAAGLSAIAVCGMTGALFCVGASGKILLHLALLGACLGFLRYNFNPASVFLGDSGSMFLGFMLSVQPLITHTANSFLVSVAVPFLAMGVPIFDTALAILRRTVRSALSRRENGADEGNGRVMTADTEHLHHRILRKFASQRKAALALYALALLLVGIGLGGLMLKGRAVALYIVGFMCVAVIVVRDMRRIELWDAGRLLESMAHDTSQMRRRRFNLLRVPMLVVGDLAVMAIAWVLSCVVQGVGIERQIIQRWMVLRMVTMFFALVFFRAYSTVWPRAVLSNFLRLALAVVCGTAAAGAVTAAAQLPHSRFVIFSLIYALLAFCGFMFIRKLRSFLRDLFYLLDVGRLREDPSTRRILVYGAGLRYAAFRRELVRGSSANRRVIMGLVDDDVLLRGHYIGGTRILGTLEDVPRIVKEQRVDDVVVACDMTQERREQARRVFAECGVKATYFTFAEGEL